MKNQDWRWKFRKEREEYKESLHAKQNEFFRKASEMLEASYKVNPQ